MEAFLAFSFGANIVSLCNFVRLLAQAFAPGSFVARAVFQPGPKDRASTRPKPLARRGSQGLRSRLPCHQRTLETLGKCTEYMSLSDTCSDLLHSLKRKPAPEVVSAFLASVEHYANKENREITDCLIQLGRAYLSSSRHDASHEELE